MSIADLANLPCGREAIGANDLQSLFHYVEREGLAGAVEDAESRTKKFMDGMYEYYVNALLSAPSTHGVNAISNMVPVTTRVLETLASAGISRIKSKLWASEASRVTYMEALAEAHGIGEGFKEAWEFLGIRFGKYGVGKSSEEAMARMSIPEALASRNKLDLTKRSIKGHGLNWVGHLVNIPGGALTRMDEVYKVINYRAEVSKRAMRRAISEMSADGASPSKAAIQERFKALKSEALDNAESDIAMQGVADAERRTFTNRPSTALDRAMAESGHTKPGLRWVVPFRRTMVNLISYGAGMTPAPLLNPSSATWRALQAGGAEADEALGRMAAGTMLISGLAYMLGDSLDGEAPANTQARDLWQKDGHAPDSVVIAGERYSVDTLGPISPWLKVYARFQTGMSNIDEVNDEDGTQHIMTMANELMFYTADVMIDEHWVSTLAEFFTAMSASQREGSFRPMGVYTSKVATGFVPNFMKKEITRRTNPEIKDINSLWDSFKAKVPGLADSVANKISVWGEPIRYDHFLDPAYEEASIGKDPVSVEMRNIGLEFPERRRTITVGDKTVRMTPEEFMQYQILSGQGVGGALPLREVIKNRIKSPAYKKMSKLGKSEYLKDAMNAYARRAKYEVIQTTQLGERINTARRDYYERRRDIQ